MKLFKWAYGALALVASIALIISFFIPDTTPGAQITLLINSVGYGFVSGIYVGKDL